MFVYSYLNADEADDTDLRGFFYKFIVLSAKNPRHRRYLRSLFFPFDGRPECVSGAVVVGFVDYFADTAGEDESFIIFICWDKCNDIFGIIGN